MILRLVPYIEVVAAIREGWMYRDREMAFEDLIALELHYKIDPNVLIYFFS